MTDPSVEPPVLLATKLYVPRPRVDQVARPRLVERLQAGLRRHAALTLVSAPAGFGKTTLLSTWVGGLAAERHVAWLSLGEEDNDPIAFWTYLVAALREALPDAAGELMARLHSPDVPEPTAVVTMLVNALASADPVLLLLDDYHEIETESIHSSVAQLMEHLPPTCHLVIASRTDPPLPIAMLRAGGRLTEVRAPDLRFTDEEALIFFNTTMRLGLSADDVEALTHHTEGWIAGLQLAALSLQGRADAASFVRSFTGSHRYVMDYLVEEVLGRQSPACREFLLRTSVLRSLSGPLCNALTGRDDGQAMLEQLERAQLFVVPLDDERRWYRYHHLFAEFLLSRLRREQPDEVTSLHLRAASWFEGEGRVRDAVHHALAAEDYERAAALVQEAAHTLLSRGDSGTLLGWLESLPEPMLDQHPVLGLIYALVNVYALRLDVMARRLEAVAAALPPCPQDAQGDESEARALWGRWYAVHAYWTRLVDRDYETSLDETERALSLLPASPVTLEVCFWRHLARLNTGFTLAVGYNRLTEAADAFAEVAEGDCAALNPYGALAGLSFLGRMQAGQCRLYAADAGYQRALTLLDRLGAQDWQLAGYVTYGKAELAWLWNRIDEAQRWIDQAYESGVRHNNVEIIVNGLVMRARLACARGDEMEMRAASAELVDAGRRYQYPGLANIAAGVEVDLLLTQRALAGDDGSGRGAAHGEIEVVRRWVTARLRAIQGLGEIERAADVVSAPMTYATLARALLALGREDEALALAATTLDALKGRDAVQIIVRLRLMQALALDAAGRRSEALATVAEVLSVAELDDLVRPFVEEGTAMVQLLSALVEDAAGVPKMTDALRAFAARLLDDFPPACRASVRERSPTTGPTSPRAQQALIDPLTERELEILRYLGSELSTPEIADALYVAASTVRTHVKNIYGKLGVHNRGEAVARATELDLI